MTERRNMTGHWITVVVSLLAMFGVIVAFIALGGGITHGGGYRVKTLVPSAASLTPGARVTMAGAPVGVVASIKAAGPGAEVTLKLTDKAVTPIPADSTVRVRAVTAVGENYVELTPGRTGRTLPSGGTLPVRQAADYVDADQILSVLQGPTRARARQLLQSTGGALRGRGDELNGTLRGATRTLDPLDRIVRNLDGDRARVGALVQNLQELTAGLGERQESIRQVGRAGLDALRATASRDGSIRALLTELPSTLRQIRTTTTTLATVSHTATPVVGNLALALRDVRPAIHSLRPAASAGRDVVAELGRAAPQLRTTLRRVRQVAPPAATALPRVRDTFCQLDPVLTYARPYRADITSFFSEFGSTLNGWDSIGHIVRLVPILGENSVAGLPPKVSTAAETLMHAGLLSRSTALNYDPYPKPGMAGRNTALGQKNIVGPEDFAKRSGFVYPHILPSC